MKTTQVLLTLIATLTLGSCAPAPLNNAEPGSLAAVEKRAAVVEEKRDAAVDDAVPEIEKRKPNCGRGAYFDCLEEDEA